MEFTTIEINDSFTPCNSIDELYKLKKFKRDKTKKENLELNLGKKIYLRSHRCNIFYEIEITPSTRVDKLEIYIYQGLIYVKL